MNAAFARGRTLFHEDMLLGALVVECDANALCLPGDAHLIFASDYTILSKLFNFQFEIAVSEFTINTALFWCEINLSYLMSVIFSN